MRAFRVHGRAFREGHQFRRNLYSTLALAAHPEDLADLCELPSFLTPRTRAGIILTTSVR